jgi:hypothetical protein
VQEEDGFVRDMDKVFEGFRQKLATIRVEFGDDKVFMSTQVEMRAGTLFDPKYHQCPTENVPSFVSEKLALLKTAGMGNAVADVGKWRQPNLYYIEVTPSQWNNYHKELA